MSEFLEQRIEILEQRLKESDASPLFAQLAAYYLEKGKADEALRMCDAGLAHHPFYTTGHLIKGKALLALSMKKEAQREFEFVAEFFPKNTEVQRLLSSIGNIVEEVPTQEVTETEEASPYSQPPSYEQSSAQPTNEAVPAGWGGMFAIEDVESSQPQTAAIPTEEQTASPYEYPPTSVTEYGAEFGTTFAPSPRETAESFEFQTSAPEVSFPSTFEFNHSTPAITTPAPPHLSEEEFTSFDVYAARMRSELSGENTLSLDSFFQGQSQAPEETTSFFNPSFTSPEATTDESLSFFSTESVAPGFGSGNEEPAVFNPPFAAEPPQQQSTTIEELANKLQGAGRITPIIDFTQKETPIVSEDNGTSIGFVTPTLAEIYAKQGWYDDAIKAYRTLAHTKPDERERFEKRIQELESLKNQSAAQ